jgi:cellobiose phosphorylase
MNYGYFDDKNKEYVITDPRTPVKWINYIGTLNFGGFVDHTGGALICKRDPSLNRITKYIQQMPSSEFKGETLYCRFKQGSGYKIFSPFFVPTLDPYDIYECHVGLGYSRIISEFYGIRIECTIFVPLDDTREIREVKITNKTGRDIEIDVISVVEYTHFDALKQFNNADWVPQTMQSRCIREKNGMLTLIQYAFMRRETDVNLFTSNHPVSSFETDRKRFLGNNEYGTWSNPLSLQNKELGDYEANRGDNIGALMHHLGEFKEGQTKCFITQLGQEQSFEKARPGIEKYRDPEFINGELNRISNFWDRFLSTMQVETPDDNMNSMLNIHNPRQCFVTKNWSRYLSYYQLGIGTRGIGFRDSSQDIMGVISHIPDESKELLKKLLMIQKADGSAMHSFNPLTMEGSAGETEDWTDRPKYYGDDHLWVVLAVTTYLKETGDLGFLEEVLPYYKEDKKDNSRESGTVLDHIKRALDFTRNDKGQHGLPHLGFADWNDTVNLRTGAESLFITHLYGKDLLEMIELYEYMGNMEAARSGRMEYERLKKTFNDASWDGKWYIRYFDYDGTPLGSSENKNGKIYLNAQSWAVISGLALPDRAEKALDSLKKFLNTLKGIKVSWPGFDGYDRNKGGITTFPPGAKENGGIFLHTNPWAVIAETMVGNGDRAYWYYAQINPAVKNDIADEYECEPYVYAQNILSDEHPQFGLGRNSWLTGTASWMYQAATRFILGIRPRYDGLEIDPCIPKKWDGFKVVRKYRNAVYTIEVKNPRHVNMRISRLKVDGKEMKDNLIPVFGDNRNHMVEAVMG